MIYIFSQSVQHILRALFGGMDMNSCLLDQEDVAILKPTNTDILLIDKGAKIEGFTNIVEIDENFNFQKTLTQIHNFGNYKDVVSSMTALTCESCGQEFECISSYASFTKYCQECKNRRAN